MSNRAPPRAWASPKAWAAPLSRPTPPPPAGDFASAYASLSRSIDLMNDLRGALPFAPLRKPLPGPVEVTSPFGYRIDPFFGRPALHTGMDLHGEYGEAVHATAAGRVTVAGPTGGYGNMVEIDHGAGLATRYGHLSRIDVAPGQWVKAGQDIGAHRLDRPLDRPASALRSPGRRRAGGPQPLSQGGTAAHRRQPVTLISPPPCAPDA